MLDGVVARCAQKGVQFFRAPALHGLAQQATAGAGQPAAINFVQQRFARGRGSLCIALCQAANGGKIARFYRVVRAGASLYARVELRAQRIPFRAVRHLRGAAQPFDQGRVHRAPFLTRLFFLVFDAACGPQPRMVFDHIWFASISIA